jgi:hypothetical protein
VLFRPASPDDASVVAQTWEYDGVSWTRIDGAVAPPPRSGGSMVYDDARGAMVLYGGGLSDTWTYYGP